MEFSDNSRLWWTLDASHISAGLNSVTEWLLDKDDQRRRRYIKDLSLYKNSPVNSLNEFITFGSAMLNSSGNPKLNIIRSMTDSITARITKQNPKPQVITSGGTPAEQSKAKNLDDYIYGNLVESGAYQLGRELFREKAVFGSSVAKVFSQINEKKKTGTIKVERVMPWELLVDPVDGAYGSPRAIIHVKYVSRELLLSKYPKLKKVIAAATNDDGTGTYGSREDERSFLYDIVRVVDAFKVKDTDDDKGRHVMAIDSGVLVDEDFNRDTLPFEIMHWNAPLIGFWGTGITHEAEGIQSEINELLNKISQAYYYHAVPTLAVAKGSVDLKDLDNSLKGRIVQYKQGGTPPTMITKAILSPEIYAHLDRLYQRGFEDTGISQLSAQSRKPSGLDSGIALREFNDIESARFVLQGVEYEDFFINLAYKIIDESRALTDAGYKIKTIVESKKNSIDNPMLKELDFSKDADPRNNIFKVKIFPVSSLPQTPAGKLASIQAMFGSGLITDRNDALSLLDFPDLRSALLLETSTTEAVKVFINNMLESGIYIPPEEYYDLGIMDKIAKQYFSLAVVRDWDEIKKQNLRTLIKQTKELQLSEAKKTIALQQSLVPQQPQGGPPPQQQQAPQATPMGQPPQK